jgi:Terminase RNaseH-like domain
VGVRPHEQKPDYLVGLDLGQWSDYTAAVVLERTLRPDEDGDPGWLLSHYACRLIRRWQLKTAYDAIVDDVVKLVATKPLDHPKLAVDITGVGRAVLDVLKKAQPRAYLRPVLITAGHQVSYEEDAWHVPKKELVSTLQVLLQGHRLKVAALPERELLVKELLAFKVKITTAANKTFEAWRERDHDDLVLAVALAAWIGEKESGGRGVASVVTPAEDADDNHGWGPFRRGPRPYWMRHRR